MKIKATYTPEQEAYELQADEQRMMIPSPFMSHFVSTCEVALYHRNKEIHEARVREAKRRIEEAAHPDVLPFAKETEQPRRQGRPKGIHTPKSRLKPKPPPPPKEPEPPPFKHTPFR